MNDKRDMAPMVWGYIKSRETARRMEAYAGEVTSMHPFYAYDSPARAKDMDLATTNAYAGPNHITANIQHGSWTVGVEPGKAPQVSWLTSNKQETREDLQYSREDLLHIEEWVKVCTWCYGSAVVVGLWLTCQSQRHVETTWHSLGTCSMAPKEGNSIVKHGVLDERLNVHGVKGLKVADLSICPDNVGCNTYSTALLIGEKCAVLTAEDLGKYSCCSVGMIQVADAVARLLRPRSGHEGAGIPRSAGGHRLGPFVIARSKLYCQ